MTEDDLGDHFRGCGDIDAIRFSMNWQSKQFKGFGYIEFKKPAAVIEALKLHGKEVKGRHLKVDFDTSQQKNSFRANNEDDGNQYYNKKTKTEVFKKRKRKERGKMAEEMKKRF